MDAKAIIDEILVREGGAKFTNRPADRGGPTKYGITQATLSRWWGKPVTIEDVQNLTEAEARQIYESEYIAKPGFDKIAYGPLQAHVIDFGVNSGQETSIKYLQSLVGALVDGQFGPKSQLAVNSYPDQAKLTRLHARERLRFLGRLITRDPKQAENASGWINRVTEFMV